MTADLTLTNIEIIKNYMVFLLLKKLIIWKNFIRNLNNSKTRNLERESWNEKAFYMIMLLIYAIVH